jgi:transcriptional regulator with XRE-family HTH domain
MATLPSPTVRRRRLGMELRQLREEAGLTIEQLAETLEWSDSKISRIETGRITATPQDVQRILDVYQVGDKQQETLVEIAREARAKGWWHGYRQRDIRLLIGFESAAASIRTFEVQVVPGLFQTEEYARAVLRASHPELTQEEIDRQLDLRLARQRHLLGVSDPPNLWAILDEPVVRRPVGGVAVMRKQLEQLIRAVDKPALTIQILPLNSGEHAGMDGSFTIYQFKDRADPPVVYLESATKDSYLEDADAVSRYVLLFDHLRAAALKPADSIDFLMRLTEKYRTEEPDDTSGSDLQKTT